jgi:hypothetical protein
MLAPLCVLVFVPVTLPQDEKKLPSLGEIEARLLKAICDRKSSDIEALASDIRLLGDQQRHGLKIRVRPTAVEFRFDGECPGHDSVEFLLSNKNRDYESLLIVSKTELERVAQVWQTVQQLVKAGQPPGLEFKLVFMEKGRPRIEDLQNVFWKIDFRERKNDFVRSLEWGDDGLRIREPDMDPATVPRQRQDGQMIVILRPTFLAP